MLNQGTPPPSCGLTLPTAESESQATTLDLTECPRLAVFQEVQPPLALPYHSQTLYTHVLAHSHIHACTYTRSLAFLWKPRAGEPAAGPTICLPDFSLLKPCQDRVVEGSFFGGRGELETKGWG